MFALDFYSASLSQFEWHGAGNTSASKACREFLNIVKYFDMRIWWIIQFMYKWNKPYDSSQDWNGSNIPSLQRQFYV